MRRLPPRIPCPTWPCRRCQAAGRSARLERQAWHDARRHRWIRRITWSLVAATAAVWTAVLIALAIR